MGSSASSVKQPTGLGNSRNTEEASQENISESCPMSNTRVDNTSENTANDPKEVASVLEAMPQHEKKDVEPPKDNTPSRKKKTQTNAEGIAEMMNSIKYFQSVTDFMSHDLVKEHFKIILLKFNSSKKNPVVNLYGIKNGLVDLYLRMFKLFVEEDITNTSDQLLWNRFYMVLNSMWNGSDQHTEFCTQLVQLDAPEYLIQILGDLDASQFKQEDDQDSNRLLFLSVGISGTIHNLLARSGETSRAVFRNLNAVNVFQKQLNSQNISIKIGAFINLAYLVNEDENEIINADDFHIQEIVRILKDAINSPKRRSENGYCAIETVEALNKLAVNDNNKERILNAGALEHYEKLLTEGVTEQEEIIIIHGIWTLAFNKLCRDAINNMDRLMSTLKDKCTSDNAKLKKVAMGANWVLQGDHPEKDINRTEINNAQHIMISYNWGVKPTALQIRDKLVEAGFKVWMDVDNMTGSTLEAMADAVENAALVLVCMTHKYKESPSCRTEAEYTYQLRKPYIPLRLESNYKADGWLGIMVGTKLWFDFINNFQEASSGLIKEIGKIGHLEAPMNLPVLKAPRAMEVGSAPKPQAESSVAKYSSWTLMAVSFWLKENGLGHHTTKFSDMDGKLLKTFNNLKRDAPEFFYSSLRDDFKFSTIDILKFTDAMVRLT